MTDLTEQIAKYLAETYNGGLWVDYTEHQKETHRKRARIVIQMAQDDREDDLIGRFPYHLD